MFRGTVDDGSAVSATDEPQGEEDGDAAMADDTVADVEVKDVAEDVPPTEALPDGESPELDTAAASGAQFRGAILLEALSATGLRSIRYAHEIPALRSVKLLNDLHSTLNILEMSGISSQTTSRLQHALR